MDKRQEHTRPDGTLRLAIIRDHDDFTVSFDGYGWHTHGDAIAGELQLIGERGLPCCVAPYARLDLILIRESLRSG